MVGYGSDLRGDDAAGRLVAAALEARALGGVEVHVTHQLVPEHAAECAGRRLVVFVDASVGCEQVMVEDLPVEAGRPALTHNLHPASLIALAAALGWAPGAAVAVHVPAFDLRLGTHLSDRTTEAVRAAVERLAALCSTYLR